MKKQLNTIAVINELKGASVFFPYKEEQKKTTRESTDTPPAKELPPAVNITSPPRKQTSVSTNDHDDLVEEIRRSVKEQGKEVSYVRLSQAEKNRLADIIYSYRRQGIRTTETEIGRIAINHLIEDHKANGKASILARLLASLHV